MAHEHIVYMMLVESACIADDRPGILRYVPELVRLAERDQHLPYLAVARRAAGISQRLAGAFEDAAALLEEALKIFVDCKMQWQIGRTLYELGKLEKTGGNVQAAGDHFTQALEAFEKVGARPDYGKSMQALESISDSI